MTDATDLLRERIDDARGWIDDNRRAVGVACVAVVVGWWQGILSVPQWWPVAAVAIGAAALAGWLAGRRIEEELAEDRTIVLVEFQAHEPGGAIYELSPDRFEAIDVKAGELYQWPSASRVYECREYNPETNVAVANWRESVPGSALAAETTVDDALTAIRELRQDLEPDAARGRELQRRIRGIVRRLDRERAEAQQRALDEHVTPDVGDSATVSEVVDDMLPPDLHPEAIDDDDLATDTHPDAGGGSDGSISFDVLEDDALEPVATDGGEP